MLKRILTGLIGFPIIAIIFVKGNQILLDILFSLVSIICLYEFYNAFNEKDIKCISWIGYIVAFEILLLNFYDQEKFGYILLFNIPVIISILFIQGLITKMKYNIVDISVTFFGIFYIVFSIFFISLIRRFNNGVIYIWYLLFCSWGTDTFAYFFGITIGKHNFSKISPKKTIEGCIGGIIGAVAFSSVYTYFINKYLELNIDYVFIIIISIVLSIFSQIGDLAASSIKRYVRIKDFGDLLPGHGGLLDRIDSLIFISPIFYLLLITFVK